MKKLPDNSIVRLIDLPPGIGGAVMEDENGFSSIYINARHGHYAQLDDLGHEIAHIINDDFHNDDPIDVIEARADGLPAPLRSIPNLVKARDLVKVPPEGAILPPHSSTTHHAHISTHQAAVLIHAISDIDAWFFRDDQYDY